MSAPAAARGSRRTLWLLVLVFFGPVLLAVVMYYAGGNMWRPGGSVAHGVLLQPPPTLPGGPIMLSGGDSLDFRGRWSVVYVGRGDCDEPCREALQHTRQVRRALGREMSRVQRVFLSTGGTPNPGFVATEHPGLLVLGDGLASRDLVLRTLGQFAEGDIFVADPLGNVILRFPPGTAMKDMHEDLELLLKASRIG